MKRLFIGCVLMAIASASNASSVGVSNSNALTGGVNLECSSGAGDVLEVSSNIFPQYLTIQSDNYKLDSVKKSQGWKVYYFTEIDMNPKHYALLVQGKKVVIQGANNTNYMCG